MIRPSDKKAVLVVGSRTEPLSKDEFTAPVPSALEAYRFRRDLLKQLEGLGASI